VVGGECVRSIIVSGQPEEIPSSGEPAPPEPDVADAALSSEYVPQPITLETGKVGMVCFLVTEAAFFSTLVVTYLIFLGKDVSGPTPAQVFYMPMVLASSICLFSSSFTVHMAGRALHQGVRSTFIGWWAVTIVLGMLFLTGTGFEWHDLIFNYGLTPARNLFGTTYFTLVGFHALHVTIGLIIMLIALGFALAGQLPRRHPLNGELVSWYWHFVDGVWVVVFTVVYLVGR
jgi:cytochrome c oxidase subunit III